MRRTLLNTFRTVGILLTSLTLAACGGGGGGGDSASISAPPQAQADTDTTDSTTPNESLAPISDNTYKIAYMAEDVIRLGQFWSDPMFSIMSTQANTARAAQAPVVTDCPLAGTATQISNPDPSGATLTREITYSNCQDPAAIANGQVTIVTALGAPDGRIAITGQSTRFSDLNLVSEEENLTLNGTADYSVNNANKTFVMNLSIHDNLNNQSVTAENIVATAPVDSILVDHFYRFTLTGKLHYGGDGTLDFNKTDFNSTQLRIAGKNGTSMTLEAINTSAGRDAALRQISADTDADGFADRFIAIPWSKYYPKGGNNALPTANVTPVESSVAVASQLSLSGAGSLDGDYNPLSFQWQIAQQPEGSSVSIAPSNAVSPIFSANTPGLYEVHLTVDDGTHSHTELAHVTVQ